MPNPQAGTSYTNLSQIIAANNQNQLGNTIQSGVQKGISGLNTNLNQAQQQFQQGVNNSNLNTQANQNTVNNTITGITAPPSIAPAQATQAPTQTTSALTAPPTNNNKTATVSNTPAPSPTPATANPSALSTPATTTAAPATSTTAPATTTSSSSSATPPAAGSFGYANTASSGTSNTAPVAGITPTAQQLAQFSQILQGGYNGPTGLNQQTLQNLSTQAQNLQQTGQLVNTQGGLQSLLQQYVGGNGYTTGDQNLDAIILGQTGKPQLQNVVSSTQNLNNIPTQAAAQDTALAQTTAAGNQALAQSTQGQLANAQNNILQQIQGQIAPITAQNQAFDTAAQQIYNWLNTATANPTGGMITNPNPNGATTPYYQTNQPKATTPGGFAMAPTVGPYDQIGSGGFIGIGPQSSGVVAGTPAAFDPNAYGSTVFNAATANPQTDEQAAMDSLNLAAQSGLLSPSQIAQLQPLIASGNSPTSGQANISGANDLMDLLAQTFSQQSALQTDANGNVVVPSSQTPTMQQAATAQQAAQLNALQQLSGQSPTFGTYGGAANAVTGNAGATPLGFDTTTLADLINQYHYTPPASTYQPKVNGSVMSDEQLKTNVSQVNNSLDKLSNIDGITWDWKTQHPEIQNPESRDMGVMAQKIEKVFPEAVTTGTDGFKRVAYYKLIAPIINGIKEIKTWLSKTDARIEALEQQNKILQEYISKQK